MSKPRVAIVFEGGMFRVVTDMPMEVYTVDMKLAQDRVYRLTAVCSCDREEIDAMLAGERIGHLGDGQDDLLVTGGAGKRVDH